MTVGWFFNDGCGEEVDMINRRTVDPRTGMVEVPFDRSFGHGSRGTPVQTRFVDDDDWRMYPVEKSCYQDHKPLTIPGKSGIVYTITGGNCGVIPKGSDGVIGLDRSMMVLRREMYPWNGSLDIMFHIQNRGVPDPGDFQQLIAWVVEKMHVGMKFHVGCIGGHGRTGLVLAALVATLSDEKDPLQFVRKLYCKKAVETLGQESFLKTYFR